MLPFFIVKVTNADIYAEIIIQIILLKFSLVKESNKSLQFIGWYILNYY